MDIFVSCYTVKHMQILSVNANSSNSDADVPPYSQAAGHKSVPPLGYIRAEESDSRGDKLNACPFTRAFGAGRQAPTYRLDQPRGRKLGLPEKKRSIFGGRGAVGIKISFSKKNAKRSRTATRARRSGRKFLIGRVPASM